MDTKQIKRFIARVAYKDYSQANNDLQKIIEDKLKERIKSSFGDKK
jgi:hypothetical protein